VNKYRALLVDPGNATAERPTQIFGNDRQEIDRWAEAVLKNAISDAAMVLVYQTVEQQVAMISKKGKPE